jgi:protein-L-isoaspartate(D-aspartate) O-methyltransferase
MIRIETDSYIHLGLRKKMVAEVAEKLTHSGIQDEKVLDALLKVPRHCFLDSAFDTIAYEDRAFEIGNGQTISMPFTVAYQSSLLALKPMDKVLEIGTGSAYQASILAQLGAQVFTIERQQELFKNNKLNFPFKNIVPYKSIKFFYGDGFLGLPNYAPFDKVLITAAAPFVPQALLQQLKIGGIMVIPVDENDGRNQVMKRITKQSESQFSEEVFEAFNFVPMLNGTNTVDKKKEIENYNKYTQGK